MSGKSKKRSKRTKISKGKRQNKSVSNTANSTNIPVADNTASHNNIPRRPVRSIDPTRPSIRRPGSDRAARIASSGSMGNKVQFQPVGNLMDNGIANGVLADLEQGTSAISKNDIAAVNNAPMQEEPEYIEQQEQPQQPVNTPEVVPVDAQNADEEYDPFQDLDEMEQHIETNDASIPVPSENSYQFDEDFDPFICDYDVDGMPSLDNAGVIAEPQIDWDAQGCGFDYADFSNLEDPQECDYSHIDNVSENENSGSSVQETSQEIEDNLDVAEDVCSHEKTPAAPEPKPTQVVENEAKNNAPSPQQEEEPTAENNTKQSSGAEDNKQKENDNSINSDAENEGEVKAKTPASSCDKGTETKETESKDEAITDIAESTDKNSTEETSAANSSIEDPVDVLKMSPRERFAYRLEHPEPELSPRERFRRQLEMQASVDAIANDSETPDVSQDVSQSTPQDTPQVAPQDTPQVEVQEIEDETDTVIESNNGAENDDAVDDVIDDEKTSKSQENNVNENAVESSEKEQPQIENQEEQATVEKDTLEDEAGEISVSVNEETTAETTAQIQEQEEDRTATENEIEVTTEKTEPENKDVSAPSNADVEENGAAENKAPSVNEEQENIDDEESFEIIDVVPFAHGSMRQDERNEAQKAQKEPDEEITDGKEQESEDVVDAEKITDKTEASGKEHKEQQNPLNSNTETEDAATDENTAEDVIDNLLDDEDNEEQDTFANIVSLDDDAVNDGTEQSDSTIENENTTVSQDSVKSEEETDSGTSEDIASVAPEVAMPAFSTPKTKKARKTKKAKKNKKSEATWKDTPEPPSLPIDGSDDAICEVIEIGDLMEMPDGAQASPMSYGAMLDGEQAEAARAAIENINRNMAIIAEDRQNGVEARQAAEEDLHKAKKKAKRRARGIGVGVAAAAVIIALIVVPNMGSNEPDEYGLLAAEYVDYSAGSSQSTTDLDRINAKKIPYTAGAHGKVTAKTNCSVDAKEGILYIGTASPTAEISLTPETGYEALITANAPVSITNGVAELSSSVDYGSISVAFYQPSELPNALSSLGAGQSGSTDSAVALAAAEAPAAESESSDDGGGEEETTTTTWYYYYYEDGGGDSGGGDSGGSSGGGGGGSSIPANEMDSTELAVARGIFGAYNSYRATKGLSPASWSDTCADMAYLSAKRCAEQGSLTHRLGIPSELQGSYSDILQYSSWQMGGQQAVQKWIDSTGHRRQMQCTSTTEAGVGVYQDASGRWYYAIVYNFVDTNVGGS